MRAAYRYEEDVKGGLISVNELQDAEGKRLYDFVVRSSANARGEAGPTANIVLTADQARELYEDLGRSLMRARP